MHETRLIIRMQKCQKAAQVRQNEHQLQVLQMERGMPKLEGKGKEVCGAGAGAVAGLLEVGAGAGADVLVVGWDAGAGAGGAALGAAALSLVLITLSRRSGEVRSKWRGTAAPRKACFTSAGEAVGRYCVARQQFDRQAGSTVVRCL